MKKAYLNIIFFFCSMFISAAALAEGNQGVSGAAFLELPTGSRSIGMGEAFTAMSEDLHTLYYNPAGIATLKYPELSIFHQELIQDSRFENIAGSMPIGRGYLAFSSSLFWVPPFERIDIDGNEQGKVNFYNSSNVVTYGRDFYGIGLGMSAKYIYQKIADLSVSSAAVDLGILKSFTIYSPFEAPTQNFALGFSLANIGTKAKNDPLPRIARGGVSYLPTKWMRINWDASEYFISASDLYDFTYGFDESFRMNLGLELNYREVVFFRSGYRFNDAGRYSLGVGFNYNIENILFTLDTSYSETRVFGPVYSINLTFKLIPRPITNEDRVNAEKYYQMGIKSYVADDLDSSIKYFKTSKDYNPYHKNVKEKIDDLEELNNLRKRNEKYNSE